MTLQHRNGCNLVSLLVMQLITLLLQAVAAAVDTITVQVVAQGVC
jgi:hypothetical protein